MMNTIEKSQKIDIKEFNETIYNDNFVKKNTALINLPSDIKSKLKNV